MSEDVKVRCHLASQARPKEMQGILGPMNRHYLKAFFNVIFTQNGSHVGKEKSHGGCILGGKLVDSFPVGTALPAR